MRETPDVRTTVRSANPPHLRRTPLDQVREGGRRGFVKDLICPSLALPLVGGTTLGTRYS